MLSQTSDFKIGAKRFFINHKWDKKINIQKSKQGGIKSKVYELNLVKLGTKTDPHLYKVIQKHQLDISCLTLGDK